MTTFKTTAVRYGDIVADVPRIAVEYLKKSSAPESRPGWGFKGPDELQQQTSTSGVAPRGDAAPKAGPIITCHLVAVRPY